MEEKIRLEKEIDRSWWKLKNELLLKFTGVDFKKLTIPELNGEVKIWAKR